MVFFGSFFHVRARQCDVKFGIVVRLSSDAELAVVLFHYDIKI